MVLLDDFCFLVRRTRSESDDQGRNTYRFMLKFLPFCVRMRALHVVSLLGQKSWQALADILEWLRNVLVHRRIRGAQPILVDVSEMLADVRTGGIHRIPSYRVEIGAVSIQRVHIANVP